MSDEATKPAEKDSFEKLKELLGIGRQDAGDSAGWVAVDNQHRWNREMQRANRWHQRQVEARQRALGCEIEPPYDEDEDEMGPTLINCNFQGDETIQNLARVLNVEDPCPCPPVAPPIEKPSRPWWWRLLWALLLLGSVLLGALLIWLTLRWFGGDSGAYEIIALPYQPGTLNNG